jgi:hypothetical protein
MVGHARAKENSIPPSDVCGTVMRHDKAVSRMAAPKSGLVLQLFLVMSPPVLRDAKPCCPFRCHPTCSQATCSKAYAVEAQRHDTALLEVETSFDRMT